MSDGPTTDRAQRQQAVDSGATDTAVDRVSPPSNPGGGVVEGSPRSRQIDTQRRIAEEIGADPDGVATVDRRGGMTAFLRSSGARQFAANLREQFAGQADFVEREDVAADIDPQAISGSAQVARDRRDDVAERVRESLASEDPFAQPVDFEADVSGRGVERAGLTDTGAQRRAGRQFEAETALTDAGPDDVTRTDSGFALDEQAQRRVAARQFESESDVFGAGELTASDIRDTSGGFGLAEESARELAAAELSGQVDGTVSPSDVTLDERDGGGFEAVFERGGN